MGFGKKEGSRLKIDVKDMKKMTIDGLDLNSGHSNVVKRNGVRFSSLRGSLSGVVNGVNLNSEKWEVLRDFKLNEIKAAVIGQKKETLKKMELSKGDPDWLPEEGNCVRSSGVRRRGNSVCKRQNVECGQTRNSPLEEHEGTNVSKPIIQALPAPNSIKDLFLSSGWKIVSQGVSDPTYVSPSGSVYGSLVKALEAFKCREKEWSSSQLVDDKDDLCKENEHTSPSMPVEVESKIAQEELVFGNSKYLRKSCIKDECVSGNIQNGEKDPKWGCMFTGDNPRKPETYEGEVEEVLLMPEETGGQVNEVVRDDEKLKFCIKGETVVVNNNDQISNYDVNQEKVLEGVRRSVRINGRHVPVDSELDIEICDGDYYFDPSNSLDGLTLESDKEASSIPEKVRFREVREVLASCVAEPSLKHELDKENRKEDLPIPEKVICREVPGVLKSFMKDENGKSGTKDDYLSNETKNPDLSSVVPVKNDQNSGNEMVEVRRSTRINGRHVPVDRELDIEMWSVDDCINSFNFVVNRVENKLKETTVVSKVGNFEGESPTKGNILLEKTPKKKCVGGKTPVSKKCFPSSKKNGKRALMTEKHSPSFANKRKSVRGVRSYANKKKKRSGGCSLIVRRTGKGDYKENILSERKISILSWLIDSGTVIENERVVYKIKNNKGNTLKGWVTRGGIRCNCCKKVLSLLEFEVHAGSDLRQPWNNTCLTSGKTLMRCQSEAWEKEKKQRKIAFQIVGVDGSDPSDDTCGICADGGHLICCDGCPSTFHQDCVMLKSLPEGSWYCPFCRCAFCTLADYRQDTSNETTNLLCCNQCGCKYHIGCVWENSTDKMRAGEPSYCGNKCEKIASGLLEMLGVPNPIGESFSWTLLRRTDEEEGIDSDQRQSIIMECNVKLSLAFLVLHECFVPLVDPRTGLDMISQAVYNCGSNFKRLHYEGFHTVILEKDGAIISVATLRIHGTRVAEMPFIGTRTMYRRQGMCRRLLNAIEEMLFSLSVEKLIIPAVPDMLETWMRSFSFKHLDSSHRDEIRNLNMMLFAETTLLQKSICNNKDK